MSDQWGHAPQQGGYGQQPNYPPTFQQPGYQGQQSGYQDQQSGYRGQSGYQNQQQPYGQPAQPMPQPQQAMQQPMSPYGQPAAQPVHPVPPVQQQAIPQQSEPKTGRMSSATSRLISGLVVLAIVGGGAIMYFVTHNGNSGGGSANASNTAAASGNGSGGGSANSSGGGSQAQSQACNAYLAIEQPMVSQINQASGVSQQVSIFQASRGKFSSLASSTAPGQLQSQIQKVADDLGALVSFVQSNTDTSSTPPPQFTTLWNAFQSDANATADACSGSGSGGSSGSSGSGN